MLVERKGASQGVGCKRLEAEEGVTMNRIFGSAPRTLLALSAVLLLMVVPAWAIPHISFEDLDEQGGDVSFSGNLGDPLVGSDIVFDTVLGPETGATNLTCVGCLLDFTTGAFSFAMGNSQFFEGGGSYVLTGSAFDGATLVASGVLLSGVFDDFVIATLNTTVATVLVTGGGTDVKNPDLLAHFGLVNPFTFAQTEITSDAVIAPPSGEGNPRGFSSTTINADLDNFPGGPPPIIPEPTTLLLLGAGLAGLGIWHRRSSGRRS
jgi:PEP-CTERM motif